MSIPYRPWTPAPAAAAAPTWSETQKDASVTLSNGDMTASAAGGDFAGLATVAITSGQKVRFEITADTINGGGHLGVGVGNASTTFAGFLGEDANSAGFYSDNQNWNNGFLSPTFTFAAGDVVDVDVDFDASGIEIFVNNVSQGTWTYTVSGDLFAAYDIKGGTITLVAPSSFTNAPPAGYTKYGA